MSWLTEKELRERDPDFCRFCPGGESKEQCDRCRDEHEGDDDDDTNSEQEDDRRG